MKLEKAYDFKALGKHLVDKGILKSEEFAQEMITDTMDFLKQSAVMSVNKYDDLLLAVYPMLEAELLAQAEKIHTPAEDSPADGA